MSNDAFYRLVETVTPNQRYIVNICRRHARLADMPIIPAHNAAAGVTDVIIKYSSVLGACAWCADETAERADYFFNGSNNQ